MVGQNRQALFIFSQQDRRQYCCNCTAQQVFHLPCLNRIIWWILPALDYLLNCRFFLRYDHRLDCFTPSKNVYFACL